MGLTEEQRLRMEQKRAEALAKKSKTASIANTKQPLSASSGNVAKVPPSVPSSSCVKPNVMSVISSSSGQLSDQQSQLSDQQRLPGVQLSDQQRSSWTSSGQLSDQQKQLLEEKRRAAKLTQQARAASSAAVSPAKPAAKPAAIPAEVRRANNTNNFYSLPPRVTKGACSLLPGSKFELDVGYHQQLLAIVKTVPSAQYNAAKKTWTFLISDHDTVIRKLAPLKPEVEVTPLPPWILATFRKPRDLNPALVDLSTIDPFLLTNLMPFQQEGVKYGVSRDGRVLIADDMGLGKTVQALALASYYREAWPVLVVCQATLKYNWRSSILRWLPNSITETDVGVVLSGRDYIGSDLFTIITYELVSKKQKELREKNYQFIILDESHCIKDFKSARTKALEPLLKATKYLILLSGTPALSRPIELFPQISALQPRLFRYVSEFGNRYCDGKMKRFGEREVPDYSGSSHMSELSLLLAERCMIRRLKSEVLHELPSKQRCCIVLDPAGVDSRSKEMRTKQAQAEKKGINGSERHGLVLQWFNTTATAKLKAVREYIKELLGSKEGKFLVFAHHQVMLAAIAAVVEEAGVEFILIDGAVSSEARKQRVDRFQTRDAVRVAVLSITAANAGITLTAASLVIFAELFWNPGVLTQAEDRAHRIGQTDSVTIQYLVAKETADDVLWPMIQAKLNVLNKAGLSKDNFENSEARVMEDTRQAKIDDMFNSSKDSTAATSDHNPEELDSLWADLLEDDMEESTETGVESQAKRIKLN